MKLTKKYIIFELIVFVMAIMIIGGCKKKQILSTNQTETEVGVLNFNATLGEAQTATRAAESDNNVLKIASAEGAKPPHIVIETYTGVAGSSLQTYFSDKLGYFKNGNYWGLNSRKKRFLPTDGMNLYAYFATDFADRGNLINVEYIHPTTITDYPKLKFTPDTTDALNQVDLIAAKVEKIREPNILIPFRHILSQINFGVKGLNRHQITISNIRLNGVKGSGTFDYNSWSWTTDNNSQNYNYYFPDRTERGGGLGDTYSTKGTNNDSNNIYIFGDGGKFGPGTGSNFLYAQVNPNEKYKAADKSDRLDNSLMLIPQEITKNSNATVAFDYKVTINGRVIRSGENQVVSLNAYYDWKPNLRYLYLFDFSDLSQNSELIDEWQN